MEKMDGATKVVGMSEKVPVTEATGNDHAVAKASHHLRTHWAHVTNS